MRIRQDLLFLAKFCEGENLTIFVPMPTPKTVENAKIIWFGRTKCLLSKIKAPTTSMLN